MNKIKVGFPHTDVDDRYVNVLLLNRHKPLTTIRIAAVEEHVWYWELQIPLKAPYTYRVVVVTVTELEQHIVLNDVLIGICTYTPDTGLYLVHRVVKPELFITIQLEFE